MSVVTKIGLLIVVLSSANLSAQSSVSDKAIGIIDRAYSAYGGDKLTRLQSIHLQDTVYHYSQWQSADARQGSMVSYLDENRVDVVYDLKRNWVDYKLATSRLVGSHASNTPFVTHHIFKNGQGMVIDHAEKTKRASTRMTFDSADQGVNLLLDTLIIAKLYINKQQAVWQDVTYIQGQAYDVLTLHSGSPQEYTVYLNQSNGLLSRVLRKKRNKLYSYDFFEHTKSQGIWWANKVFVGSDNQPVDLIKSRNIRFNTKPASTFMVDPSYREQTAKHYIDVSKPTIKKLADGVYFVGQGWGYTLFVDAGSYFVSAGAWQMSQSDGAWQNALELLYKTTGLSKPVKQHIVTHHHDDHMMGLNEVVTHGADLAVLPEHVELLSAHFGGSLSQDRITLVDSGEQLAAGKIVLYDVSSSHANHNLIVYLPEHNILFSEDMFGSSYQKAFHSSAYWPDGDTYFRLNTLLSKLAEFDIKVDTFVSSHHARVLDKQEIAQALKMARPNKATILKRLFGEK